MLLYIQKSNIKTTWNTEENTVVFADFVKISFEILPVNWCVWYRTLTFHLYLKYVSKITFVCMCVIHTLVSCEVHVLAKEIVEYHINEDSMCPLSVVTEAEEMVLFKHVIQHKNQMAAQILWRSIILWTCC